MTGNESCQEYQLMMLKFSLCWLYSRKIIKGDQRQENIKQVILGPCLAVFLSYLTNLLISFFWGKW